MWHCENHRKKVSYFKNGRQNEVAVITYITVPIVTGYRENKTCRGGKIGGAAKINSGEAIFFFRQRSKPSFSDQNPG